MQKNGERGYEDKEFEVYDIDGLYRDSETGDNPYFDVFLKWQRMTKTLVN